MRAGGGRILKNLARRRYARESILGIIPDKRTSGPLRLLKHRLHSGIFLPGTIPNYLLREI